MQLDVFGDEIRVYAWQEGEPMPTAPLFVIHDNTYTGAWSCPIRPRSAGPATCRSAPVDQWELDGVPLHQAQYGVVNAAGSDARGKVFQRFMAILGTRFKIALSV